ncbi:MAG: C40 family peptidase [Lachnospiraceae bacterium]
MKIRKAEEKPVIIHKKKEPVFNNKVLKTVIKREENSALPERNSGSAFFYGKYKQGQKNLDNGKVSKIYNQKSIHGNVMEMELENMPGKEIKNTKNNAIKETVIKDTYKKYITAGMAKLTETAVKDTIPASGNKNLAISHQKENILPGKARKNSREIHKKNQYTGHGINLKETGLPGKKQGRHTADSTSSIYKKGKNNSMNSFVKQQMALSFLEQSKLKENSTNENFTGSTAKTMVFMAGQALLSALVPLALFLLPVILIISIITVILVSVIYCSPVSILFPQPDTGYDTIQSVLSSYYMEFNNEIMELENKGYTVSYQNTEDGILVSNFNDTLMAYMAGYGIGTTGFVMDKQGKENLKKVFGRMNYFNASSSTESIKKGDSIGEVVTTGYCNCYICCGKWSGGLTASGTVPKAGHTLAVDARNPIVPMGTKVIINGITYTVEDTGNLNAHGTDFDIYFGNHQQAQNWGKKRAEAFLAGNGESTIETARKKIIVHNLDYNDYIKNGILDKQQEKFLKTIMEAGVTANKSSCGEETGQMVAGLALSKTGCRYSQTKRMEEGYYDCSSLVYRLYKEAGVILPGTAAGQGQYCYRHAMLVNKKDLKPGDLVFYSYEKNGRFRNISHVAVYVGNGEMVHAANEDRGVVKDALRTNNVVFYARPY